MLIEQCLTLLGVAESVAGWYDGPVSFYFMTLLKLKFRPEI